jgi:hypothetical protein
VQYDPNASTKIKNFVSKSYLEEPSEVVADDEYFLPEFLDVCTTSHRAVVRLPRPFTSSPRVCAQIDRVIACSVSEEDFNADQTSDDVKFLVKWMSLPYNECTWETAKDLAADLAIAEFWARQRVPTKARAPMLPCACRNRQPSCAASASLVSGSYRAWR